MNINKSTDKVIVYCIFDKSFDNSHKPHPLVWFIPGQPSDPYLTRCVPSVTHSLIDQPSILTPYLTSPALFQPLLSSISATSSALFHHLTRQATPYSTPLLDKPRPLYHPLTRQAPPSSRTSTVLYHSRNKPRP